MGKEYTGYKLTPAILESLTCNTIDWSSALTLPPAELPTAIELISAGRLNQIESKEVRLALLSYIQETRRAEDFTEGIKDTVVFLSDRFPDLFTIRFDQTEEFKNYNYPRYTCNYAAMRDNHAFLNALNLNRMAYTEYSKKAVQPVTEILNVLHEKVDHALGIVHMDEESK